MEFQQQQPIYLQIANLICEKILRQEWQAATKILSIRELAAELEVNPNTVARTYNYLETNNIIHKQRGVGYFVATEGYGSAMKLIKERFLEQELPRIFKTLDLLQLSSTEIEKLYSEWRRDENK